MDPRAELRDKEVEILLGTIDALETDRWMERYAIQS